MWVFRGMNTTVFQIGRITDGDNIYRYKDSNVRLKLRQLRQYETLSTINRPKNVSNMQSLNNKTKVKTFCKVKPKVFIMRLERRFY